MPSTRTCPHPLPQPHWVGRNEALAESLGLDLEWFHSEGALQALTGNQVLPGTQPLATVYSGHPVRPLGRSIGRWASDLAG